MEEGHLWPPCITGTATINPEETERIVGDPFQQLEIQRWKIPDERLFQFNQTNNECVGHIALSRSNTVEIGVTISHLSNSIFRAVV